jgi:hypothetical protein
MYERLYQDVTSIADRIISEAEPRMTTARSVQQRGLAVRTAEDVNERMRKTAEQARAAMAPDDESLKANIASYLNAIKTAYSAEDDAKVDTGLTDMPVSGGQAGAVAKASDMGRRLMRDLMKDYGLSKEYAAGIVGNLDYETAGFKHMQELTPLVKGSRGGWGIAQWTGPRRVAFEKYAKDKGLDPSSYEANYGFLKYEFENTSEGRFLDKYKSVEDPAEAARIFSSSYLRPSAKHANMKERINRAQLYAGIEDI